MIYDLPLISRIRSAYVKVALDPVSLASSRGGVLERVTQEKLADELVHYCQPLGVDIQPADIDFRQSSEKFGVVLLSAAWRPKDRPAEFHYGPQDGVVMMLHDSLLFQTVSVPVASGLDRWDPDATGPMPVTVLDYDWVGWNESTRNWVYRLRKVAVKR